MSRLASTSAPGALTERPLAAPHRRRAPSPSDSGWPRSRIARSVVPKPTWSTRCRGSEQPRTGSRRCRAGYRGQRDLRHIRGADDPAALASPRGARPRRDRRRGAMKLADRVLDLPETTRAIALHGVRVGWLDDPGFPSSAYLAASAAVVTLASVWMSRQWKRAALGCGRGARVAACALVRNRRARCGARDRGRRRRRIAGARRVRRAEPGARFGSARRRVPIDHPRPARHLPDGRARGVAHVSGRGDR